MSHTPSIKYKTVNWITNKKSASYKPQAASFKRQAGKDTSRKLQAPSPSSKRQASSRKRQAP